MKNIYLSTYTTKFLKMSKLSNALIKRLFFKELGTVKHKKITRYVHQYGFDTNEEIIENCLENVMMIGINLPDRKNVLTETSVEKLCESVNYFGRTDEISVAILHGIGGNFCTGLEPTDKALEKSRELIQALNIINKPIIGSLSGYTSNFGFHLAIMCDIRIMEETALAGFGEKLQRSELSDFLIEKLVLNVGLSRAMELISVSTMWSAAKCYESNFINRSVACGCSLGQALSWAQSIAKAPVKTIINEKSKFLSVSRSLALKVQ